MPNMMNLYDAISAYRTLILLHLVLVHCKQAGWRYDRDKYEVSKRYSLGRVVQEEIYSPASGGHLSKFH